MPFRPYRFEAGAEATYLADDRLDPATFDLRPFS
jgi:hypothetical protein